MKQFIFLLALLLPSFVWADVWQDPETKVNYEYTPGKTEAQVKAGHGTAGSPNVSGTITILSEITVNGAKYTVTSIGEYAFYNCSGLTSINIPEGVTSIEPNAFDGCSSLTSINIPNSVISIENNAFSSCTSLTSIIIPEGVTSIGGDAFRYCSGLTSVTIPEGVTIIESGTFCGCSSLTSIIIPEGVTSIGGDAFSYCSNLISIIIPEGVTSIGDRTFSHCSSLTSINIPNSVISIGNNAFSHCTSLTSINIPKGVTSIGDMAFENCYFLASSFANNSSLNNDSYWGTTFCDEDTKDGLIIKDHVVIACRKWATSAVIPKSVAAIGDEAFSGCSNLTSINIPNSVISIGNNAFGGCTNLTSINIPESVTEIGYETFSYCSNLTSIVVDNGNTKFDSRNNCNALIETSDGILIRGCKNTIIPEGVTSIGRDAFSGCSSLTSVTIPESVTEIGFEAFSDCTSLTSINIPEGVTIIESGTFQGCSSLTSINIPEGVTIIEPYAFLCCSSLTSINIPEGVTSIGSIAFEGCSSLTSIKIPESVTRIEDFAFRGCSNLTSINIPEGVKVINNGTFSHCTSLTSINIPNSVILIDLFAFSDCTSLTSINIPESVTSIGYNAFGGCSNITALDLNCEIIGNWFGVIKENIESVTLGENVKSIGYHAFEGFSNLTSINIPESVTSIEGNAFSGCSNITSITIPNSVTSIGSYAFIGCSGLTSISVETGNTEYDSRNNCYAIIETATNTLIAGCRNTVIPNSVKSIGNSAFSGCSGLTSITIPNSVTRISDGAFYNCSGLTSITIPNSVTSIGDYAFSGCSGLTSITIPNSVTRISDGAFYNCSGLTSITIPNSVTSIGDYAFRYCSGLTSIKIPNSVTSIGGGAFRNCSLKKITSKIVEPFDIYSSFDNNTYSQATLHVPAGTIDAYQSKKGWKEFQHIEEIGGVTTIAINVINEKGEGLTNQVNILWYEANGKEIGRGEKLSGIADSTEVYYSVLLDETLGRVYREVKMQKASVDEEMITCQLKKIGRVQLEGRVSATDIDKTTATVTIQQMLNGKYEQHYTTQTNEQGVFAVEVYDDETEITISGEGYLDATLHRDGLAGNGNIGTIPLNLISGFSIAANIVLQKAIAEGEAKEVTTWTDGLNNIEFSLTNTTKNADITDFTIQNGKVIIKTGADVGDEIKLKATSKQGVFADTTTSFTIADGANAFELQLTERGGFDAICTASSNGNTVGYLYNSGGFLESKGSYSGETLSLRHLMNGTYTLVSMGQSLLLGNMTRLDDIKAVGLNEGTDYVVTIVEVADGKLAKVNVDEVPRMDDTRFYYTSNDTYFSANKAAVIAGNYLTLQAHVDFKPEHVGKAGDVVLTIDLPEGCQMVENSVIANRQAVPHTVNGNRMTMTLNKEQYQSQVRFCVIPTLNQSYTVTAMAQFDIDGQVTQPIGTAQFEAKGLSLSVPEHVAKTNVTINGTAKGHSEVSIYDNDVLIGKTASLADGSWTAECELFKPYSHSFHEIYAKITTENGMELTSEVRLVEYDKNRNVPEKVMMTFYNDWMRKNIDVEFNLENGTTTPSHYPFYHGTDFTFLADFTRNDTTQIKNVNIKVLNSDGTVRTMPATFDGKQGKWVATTNYSSSSRLPKNVMVEYDMISNEASFDSLRFVDDYNQKRNLILNYIANVDSTKCKIIEASDSMWLAQYQTRTQIEPIYIKLVFLNYDEYINELQKGDYQTIVSDSKKTCLKDTIMPDKYVSWIWSKNDKTLLKIELSNTEILSVKRQESKIIRRTPWYESILDGLIPINFFAIREMINEYNSGFQEYSNWLTYFGIVQKKHNNLYQKIKRMLNAKCPDGTLKLANSQYEWGKMLLENNWDDTKYLWNQYEKKLEKVRADLDLRLNVSSAVTASLSLASIVIGPAKIASEVANGISESLIRKCGEKFSPWLINALGNITTELGSNIVGGGASGLINGGISDIIDNLLLDWYTIEDFANWYHSENDKIIDKYEALLTSIPKHYKKCESKKDEEEQDEPKNEQNDNDFKGNGSTPQIDPSGYVYEAVTSNRLEGVTVTCYQKVQTEDMYGDLTEEAVAWNAEDYSQQNPLKTDATGFYRWDVPQGWWQVMYEKEGYETAYSDWLPVPPPQLDVNIGMKQSTPPMVKKMRGYESGITIELSKYMRPGTVTTENVTVTRNGASEEGTIELLNAEKAPLGEETYVSKVKFIPETPFSTADLVVVTVHKEVESYCGVKMTKDHIETVKIEPEVKSIVADSLITVLYQGEKEMRIVVLPKEAAAGKTLHVETSSQMIASISSTDVTIDEDGAAVLTLGGELPGGAVITFNVDSTDVTATSKVKVVISRGVVAEPTASIRSGETVISGTQLTLTCDTEGATIYYTLDGSCPCDEQTRILYTGPITLPVGTVTVKAIAVAENMDESDVVTFVYTVLDRELIVFADSPMRTYCSAFPLYFTGADGLKAYIASGYSTSDEVVILRQVETVPAETGLLLVSNETNKSYEVPFTNTDFVYSNLLVGVTEDTEISDGYVLTDGLFAAVEGSAIVKGGEAYLKIPTTDKKQLKIRFTDTLNGVEDMKSKEDDKTAWFTIQGARLNHKPTKRGIYLHGGKKVMVK